MQQSEPTRAVPGMCVGRRRRVFETMVQDAATVLLLWVPCTYCMENKTEKTHGKNKQKTSPKNRHARQTGSVWGR